MICTQRFLVLALLAGVAVSARAEAPRSGYSYLTPETRAMQDDDFENPGMEGVGAGARLFSAPGSNGKRCSDCHGAGGERLDAAQIARYPKFSATLGKPQTLQGQLQACWRTRLGNEALAHDSQPLVELESFVRNLARGEPVAVDVDGPMQPYYRRGKALYYTRFGQIDLACNHCHDDYAGRHLRGQLLSQGQTNGFPVYRLAKGQLTGLHTRMKQCFVKFRAEPFPLGSDELLALEVFLASRGNGLKIETPAVRF